MNRNIRRLGIFFLIAFAVMVGDVTYWQVIDASSMQARPDNPRLQYEAQHIRRGLIYDRNHVLLAGRRSGPNGSVQRYYTDPSLSHVIGYYSTRYGRSELEKTYDSYLTGQVIGTSWNTVIDRWEHKPVVGDDLTLTIDDRIQRAVAADLPGSPSAAVVADPRTGEILAMASNPGFDANQINDSYYWQSLLNDQGSPLINRATGGYYPPGSTFKVVTLSAALDAGIMNLSTQFNGEQATGPLNVDGFIIPASTNNLSYCGGRAVYPPITLAQALVCSDNIVFAQVGLALGWGRFLDYAHGFGLGQLTPFDIPTSRSRVRTPGEVLSRPALASSAFGQGGLHVSPLQMLLVAEGIANGGDIPYPSLVQQVTDPSGSTIKTATTGTLYHPISPGAADSTRQAMVQVVEQGSGELAQIPGVQVAGKTGTAETEAGRSPHSWFICFAPADHPRVAVAVIVEHGGEGATVAAPIAREILQAALPLVR